MACCTPSTRRVRGAARMLSHPRAQAAVGAAHVLRRVCAGASRLRQTARWSRIRTHRVHAARASARLPAAARSRLLLLMLHPLRAAVRRDGAPRQQPGRRAGRFALCGAQRVPAAAFDAACTRAQETWLSSLAAAAVSGPQCADGVRSAERAARARASHAPRCALPQPQCADVGAQPCALHFPAASRVSASRRCFYGRCCCVRGPRRGSCCAIRAASTP